MTNESYIRTATGALVNIDDKSLNAYKSAREKALREKELRKEVEDLKNDVHSIKNNINKILEILSKE